MSELCPVPGILQNRQNENATSSKKVVSVVVEPSISSKKKKSTTYSSWRSKYELEPDGWNIDAEKNVGSTKNTLNLDNDISEVHRVYRFADVKMGSIKMTF